MTLLIALEFKHSIIRVALRRESIVQVKTVVLISLLALSRKFIILDSKATGAETIAALALATLVLGVVYWLLASARIACRRPVARGWEVSDWASAAPHSAELALSFEGLRSGIDRSRLDKI